MSKYDAIVIGSGIGGLTAAVQLSNYGKHVLVVEQATDFGGYSNPFKRKKFHFDPGIHYLGDLGPDGGFRRTLEQIGVWERLEFLRLNDDCYDRYVFPELDFRMPASRTKFEERLNEHFPGKAEGISKYMQILNALHVDPSQPGSMKDAFATIRGLDNSAVLSSIRKATYGQVMDHLFGTKEDSALIKGVLGGPCGDIGLPPGRVSATALFGIFNHYVDGAFYPKGGSGGFRDAFTDHLTEKGAELKNRTRVNRIITEGDKAIGIQTEAGEEFFAPIIVSNVDPTLTYGKLVGEDNLRPKLVKKIDNMEMSYASYCLFLGTDLGADQMDINQENIWYYPDTDIDKVYAEMDSLVPEGDFSFFMSSPSQKDPNSGKCPEGTNTLEVVLLTHFEPFKKWSGQKAMRREEDYKALKDEIQEKIVTQIESKYVPNLSEHIVLSELGTPVTNEFYAAPVDGAIYGPAHTPDQIGLGRFMPRGNVKNLYLCGAGVFNCGIAPCSVSGYFAAEIAMKEHAQV